MFPTLFVQTLLISTSFIPNVYAQSAFDSITDPSLRAQFALQTLQIWYNAGTGLWDTAGWWNSANAMTMIANFAKLEPDNKPMQKFAGQVFRNTILQAPAKNPQPGVESKRKRAVALGNTTFVLDIEPDAGSGYSKSRLDDTSEPFTSFPAAWAADEGQYIDVMSLPAFAEAATVSTASTSGSKKAGAGTGKQVFVAAVGPPRPDDWLDGFYDDDLWWALGWIGAYDVTGNIEYLQLAEGLFMAVTKAWPSKCGGGGIWWSWKKDYVNAIANELFFSTAAHLANRAENKDFYADWAERSLQWFQGSGMINKEGTINDGLNDDCKNNGLVSQPFFRLPFPFPFLFPFPSPFPSTPTHTHAHTHTPLDPHAPNRLPTDNLVLQPRRDPRRPGRTGPRLAQQKAPRARVAHRARRAVSPLRRRRRHPRRMRARVRRRRVAVQGHLHAQPAAAARCGARRCVCERDQEERGFAVGEQPRRGARECAEY
jgi:hypothetical protein